MDGVRKFYAATREGVRRGAALAIGVVVVALVLGAANGASIADLARALAVGLMVASGLIVAFVAVGRVWPVTVTTQGVMASPTLGRTRLVPWNEIVRVTPYPIYGLRMLRIDRAEGSFVIMPMYLDDLGGLSLFVSQHAGPTHPLTQWLTAQLIEA